VRRLLILLALLSGAAFAQNARYDNFVLGPKGPVPFATVAVCTQPANTSTQPCTPLANLCSTLTDAVCTQPNPVTADSLGNFHFYVKQTQIPVTTQFYGPQIAAPVVFTDQITLGVPASLVPSDVNNAQQCNRTAYASAPDTEMNRCLAAAATSNGIGAGGGVCDCRGASAALVATGTQPVVIGVPGTGAPRQVSLLLDSSGYYQANLNNVSRCAFEISGGGALIFDKIGTASGGNGGRIIAPNGAVLDALVCNKTQDGSSTPIKVDGGQYYGNSSATFTSGLHHYVALQDASVIENVYTSICGTSTPHALLVNTSGGSTSTSGVTWLNDNWDCTGTSSGAVMRFQGQAGGIGIGNNTFIGGGAQHPGGSQNLLEVDGVTGTNLSGFNIHCGFHFETQNTPTNAILIKDASNINICANNISGPGGTSLVNISETSGGLTHDVELSLNTFNAWTNAINNSIAGTNPTLLCGGSGCNVKHWQLRASNYLDKIRATSVVADQGTACANGNIGLSAGWGNTAAATAVIGQGQTCQWTITASGTGQGANPTITWTLPTALPTSNVVCSGQVVGGTQATPSTINMTTQSSSAPVFTYNGTPTAAATLFVLLRCGP
jgi:hypothetical protein